MMISPLRGLEAATGAPGYKRAFWPRLLTTALLALVLVGPARLHAGDNARVALELVVDSPPCAQTSGTQVQFRVAARHMAAVRLVKLDFTWQPPDAVTAVRGNASGLAKEQAFVVPGQMLVEGNHGQFGMAAFGAGMTGEGIVAAFEFALSTTVDGRTPVDLRLDMATFGTGFAQRDTIYPSATVVLLNYCDASGLPLESGMFVRPTHQRHGFSSASHARRADDSAGEALCTARLFQDGGFATGLPISWNIRNTGAASVYVLGTHAVLRVPPGDVARCVEISDIRGDAFLRLDASSADGVVMGTATVQACDKRDPSPRCATAEVTWEQTDTPTVVERAENPPPKSRQRCTTLGPVYPNPFNSRTAIPLHVSPASSNRALTLTIHDVQGRRVARIVGGGMAAGDHLLYWDGRDGRGREVASGVYFCRLQQGPRIQVLRLALLR